ncbi:hypothetical protein RhiLY_09335 [Ceratobasidium sp. AG-Ba]|nr:hypothetical protein RhiLY_09335 [Ceratobasidium sp. AG-Ba]
MVAPQARSSAAAPAFPSFARAMSPALVGHMTTAASADADRRMAASGHAKSWTELLELVPVAYRDTLREPFKALNSLVEKHHNVQRVVARLGESMNKGELPTQVKGIHEPLWQVSKEFRAQEAGSQMLTAITAAHTSYVDQAYKAVGNSKPRRKPSSSPNWPTTCGSQTLAPIPIAEAEQVEGQAPVDYREDPWRKGEMTRLVADLPAFGTRIIEIGHAKVIAENAKVARKAAIKDAADVEMDVDDKPMSPDAIKAMVGAEIKRALNQNPIAKPAPKGKAPKLGPIARKGKGKTGHTNPKTGLAAPLHYGPAQKSRKQGNRRPNAKGGNSNAGPSKRSK